MMPTPTPPPPRLKRARWRLVALLGLTLLAYSPALRGGFVWDDNSHVTENLALRSLAGLRAIWTDPFVQSQYYPLVYTSFWVEYHLWGLHPAGYHLLNVLLQAVNAVLVWRLLLLLAVPGAWWAAAVFALHPVHVESVAWIAERKNLLSAFFALLATLSYLRVQGVGAAASAEPTATPRGRWQLYLGSLVSFASALLSKTVTCTLPVVLAMLLWWKRGRLTRRDVCSLAPFVAIGAALAWLTIWCEHRHILREWAGGEWSLSLASRVLVAGRAIWFYVGKLLWPVRLTFIYPRWAIDPHVWIQWLAPAAAIGVLLGCWCLRRRLGRGPFVAGSCFVIMLGPALGFVNYFPMRFSFVADHFQYHASLALIAAVVAMVALQLQRLGRLAPMLGSVGGGALLLVLGLLTWRQEQIYHDPERLWRDTLQKNPSAWIAYNNLGGALLEQPGRLEEALPYFRQAIRLNPTHAETHNNLGIALARLGKQKEAIAEFTEALRLKPENADVHNNLAIALDASSRFDEAIAHFIAARRLDPDNVNTVYRLGNALAHAGRFDEAIAAYTDALRLTPGYAEAHNNRGYALVHLGKRNEAIADFAEALRLKPEYQDARENLDKLTAQPSPTGD